MKVSFFLIDKYTFLSIFIIFIVWNDLTSKNIYIGNYATKIFILSSTDLQATTVTLDFRVTALEENGGDDGNSSVVELEVRVEALEGTTTDHETRISAVELDINGKA